MRIVLIILLLTTKLFGQTLATKEIDKYVKTIDSLKKINSLQKYINPSVSRCGGAVEGYYFKNKLVFIDAVNQGELGYSGKIMYLKDTVIYKIIYHEHFPEWDKYFKKHPGQKKVSDPLKMTYTDTLYTVLLSKPISFVKTSNKKLINSKIDLNLVNSLLSCGREMKCELENKKSKH
jgi:hypothetical protein